ncbi:hypothetical protein [Burkholderia pseudomallei]|uniref:hypothetical protein n=1 Tax=Burkholderia pseudomallei TaxID=28450 RepID=UPI0011C3FA1A|nr:hypothetical protein [Burkholderia pseudomallei]
MPMLSRSALFIRRAAANADARTISTQCVKQNSQSPRVEWLVLVVADIARIGVHADLEKLCGDALVMDIKRYDML